MVQPEFSYWGRSLPLPSAAIDTSENEAFVKPTDLTARLVSELAEFNIP